MLTGVADVQTAVDCLEQGALDYIAKPVACSRRSGPGWTRRWRSATRCCRTGSTSRTLGAPRCTRAGHADQGAVPRGRSRPWRTRWRRRTPTPAATRSRVSRVRGQDRASLGFTGDVLEQIRLGGELHDIGKIGTREAVLNKPGPLTPDEFEHIKEHTVWASEILAPLAPGESRGAPIVRSHHERMDGTGFPDGLPGDAIPIEARIVAVVDAFDAMTTNRAYRASRSPGEACDELRRCAGSQFDPAVVEAFQTAFPDPRRCRSMGADADAGSTDRERSRRCSHRSRRFADPTAPSAAT